MILSQSNERKKSYRKIRDRPCRCHRFGNCPCRWRSWRTIPHQTDKRIDEKPLMKETKQELKINFFKHILSRKHGGPKLSRRRLFRRFWSFQKSHGFGFKEFCVGYSGFRNLYRGLAFPWIHNPFTLQLLEAISSSGTLHPSISFIMDWISSSRKIERNSRRIDNLNEDHN
jgi:hypothetical protein